MSETIKCKIDNVDVEVKKGTTILEAAKQIGVKVPSLCYHPYLSIEGACRVCIVEVKGRNDYVASCSQPVTEGMEVTTHSPQIHQARRDIVELILDNHPDECHTCERDHNCELQRLAYATGVRDKLFKGEKKRYKKDDSSKSVVRDPEKCILCGRCVRVCNEIQGISCIDIAHRGFQSAVVPAFEKPFGESVCSSCGQCINVCPTAAFLEKDYTNSVWKALADPEITTVVQFAPSVRAAIGEGFGLPVGLNLERKIVTALRRLGFNYVFDTQFGADLTILEEASELAHRIKENVNLPMITSCSAAWVKFSEQFYPELLPNLSTCMSPMSMMGSLIKRYFSEKIGKDPAKIFSVAAMCCTAKKDESLRDSNETPEGHRYVDASITTRELIWMIKSAGIDLVHLPDGEFDHPLGESTGAGTIFGATGGVMEAALRTAHFLLTGTELPGIEFKPVREAIDSVKVAEVDIAGTKIRVAVASSLGHAQDLLESVRLGVPYHFIEIMGCLGGCVGGGGQPYAGTENIPLDKDLLKKRAQALYSADELSVKRRSHENQDVNKLYEQALERYGSWKAHEWLHTHYEEKMPRGICRSGKTEQKVNCVTPDDPRYQELSAYIEQVTSDNHRRRHLLPVLHKTQELFGYLSTEAMDFISVKMQIATSRIYGVATFYHYFHLKPKGETRINVCLGTACYVKGAGDVVAEFEKRLGIKMGETSVDGKFSLESTRCIGACGLAPVVLINDDVHSRVKVGDVKKMLGRT